MTTLLRKVNFFKTIMDLLVDYLLGLIKMFCITFLKDSFVSTIILLKSAKRSIIFPRPSALLNRVTISLFLLILHSMLLGVINLMKLLIFSVVNHIVHRRVSIKNDVVTNQIFQRPLDFMILSSSVSAAIDPA